MNSLRIEKLIPGGYGLGRLDTGQVAMLWNALPGELVTDFVVTKSRSNFIEGIATEIRETSPHREEPRDNCYLSTSPWQILSYDYELAEKKELLEEIFRQHKVNLGAIMVEPFMTDGRDYFYRNKMEYSLFYSHEDEQIHLSFRNRGSHSKIIANSSSLERTEIYQAAERIVADLNARHDEARRYQSLLLRSNQNGKVEGGLYENHRPHPIFNNLSDEILGKKYSYSPNGFFQINLPVYEMALSVIRPEITTDEVLDLYAGVGTIGLSVAREHKLTLVEVDKSAFRELEKNCQGTSASPVYAKSEEALEYITPRSTVIVDPPRAGLDIKLIERLSEVEPPKIIYLSCNPVTQARDVKNLESKYRITKVTPFNFFPHTPHLENLIILERK